MTRRDFIKNSIWAGGVFGLIVPSWVFGANRTDVAGEREGSQNYCWKKTIFCQFDSQNIKREIEQLAEDIGSRVWFGEPGSPDTIAVPCFITVIDRSSIGREVWEAYYRYCLESGDQTPCLIIDGREGLDFPSHRNFVLINPKDKRKAGLIKKLISAAKPK